MSRPIRPTLDHGVLSPSGRVSGRARAAAQKRAYDELGIAQIEADMRAPGPQPSKRERALSWAAELRELAARGFRPRYHLKIAARLEAEAVE